MDPGERFTLIQNIYATLSSPDWGPWEMVDTALSEFGARSIHLEDPARRTLERLRTLSDESLVALNVYLHPEDADPTASAGGSGAGPWEPDHFRLFVSHTSAHKQLAGDLREAALRVDIDAFVAHTAIEPTTQWAEEIERALRTGDALVALLTPDLIESRWCDQEIGVCYALGTLIVPVRIGLDPYGFIGRFQAATFDPSREHIFALRDRLFDVLASHPQTRARMVDPVIGRLVRSGSFDGTRAAWPAVQALPQEAWTDERVARVRKAARENGQVREAGLKEGDQWSQAPVRLEQHLESLGIPPEEEGPATPAADDIPF